MIDSRKFAMKIFIVCIDFFESEKAHKWGPVRPEDGKCGPYFKADCDPKSSWGPCCSPYNICGISDDHCKCQGCVDFRADEKGE